VENASDASTDLGLAHYLSKAAEAAKSGIASIFSTYRQTNLLQKRFGPTKSKFTVLRRNASVDIAL
jgi:hypothetical protein